MKTKHVIDNFLVKKNARITGLFQLIQTDFFIVCVDYIFLFLKVICQAQKDFGRDSMSMGLLPTLSVAMIVADLSVLIINPELKNLSKKSLSLPWNF